MSPVTLEQYESAELLIAPCEVSDANWGEVRFAVGGQHPRVLLGREPAGRAPGGLHTTDRQIVLSDDERLAATALALVRQPYDHRWLLHVVAGTHEAGSPHRVVVDVAGQQHLLGPDGTLLLVPDRWYRLRLAQDPTGPVTRHSDAETIASTHLVEEVWAKVKTPQHVSDDTVDVPTLYVDPREDRRVERKRAFILAHTYGPYLAGLVEEPDTASTLAERIQAHYRRFGRYPEDFLLSVRADHPLLSLDDDEASDIRRAAVYQICHDEIRIAGRRVQEWIKGEQDRTGEAPALPTPSSRLYAKWLGRLGLVTIAETMSGQFEAVVPVFPNTAGGKRFVSYALSRSG